MNKTLSTFTLVALLTSTSFLATGCGQAKTLPAEEEPSFAWDQFAYFDLKSGSIRFGGESLGQEGRVIPLPGTAKRADYCSVYIPTEKDPEIVETLLAQLNGKWSRIWKNKDFLASSPDHVSFELDRERNKAVSYSPGRWFGQKVETITYNRICISEPLPSLHRYAGFRLLELKSDQNDGIVVIAFRFARPTNGRSNPTLWATTPFYDRTGGRAESELLTVGEVFRSYTSGQTSREIGVYPILEKVTAQ